MFDIQLFAESWENVAVANVTFDVPLNAEGNIAKEGETATQNKSFAMKGLKADITPEQANTVLDKIIVDIGGGSYVSSSKVRTVKQGITGELD